MFNKITVFLACVLIQTIGSNAYNIEDNEVTLYGDASATAGQIFTITTQSGYDTDVVAIQLYYESLCPDCRTFDSLQFKPTVLQLAPFLNIYTNPYGNAQTREVNGHYEFDCQHGPKECYGNKLHACATDLLRNTTASVVFNACMMDYSQAGRGSDDAAADLCGSSLNLDSASIKQCAKSERASELLKAYGDQSKQVGFRSVPHILVNGVQQDESGNFMQNVCRAFKNPPPECSEYS